LKDSVANYDEEEAKELSESEFINTADLTSKQLFHYGNSTQVPASLAALAHKHLLSTLTTRFLKFPHVDNLPSFTVAEHLVTLNRQHGSNDLVDRLFHSMYRVALTSSKKDDLMPRLEHLLWENFAVLKRSLVLLPRIASGSVMRDEVRQGLKEGFTAVRRIIHAKYAHKRRELR
jgi:hypothetical protein